MLRSKLSFFAAALGASALTLTLGAAPARAQAKPGDICRVFKTHAKDGMTEQYEAGRQRHVAFHKSIKDTWSWFTYWTETGPNTGTYTTITCDHQWKDFDTWDAAHGEADGADGAKNMDPYTGGGGSSFYSFLRDLSAPRAPGAAPDALVQIIHFDVKIGAEMEFANALKKVHEAIQKSKWANNYRWYVLLDGGSSPNYKLALGMKGWADMQEPETPFPAMLEQAFGRADAMAIMETFNRTIKHQYSETLRYRPDLSYVPGK